jgi:hypothetical protein
VPDLRRQLVQVLMRDHKADAVPAVIGEHVGERQRSEALKFVDTDEEVPSTASSEASTDTQSRHNG